MTELATPPLAEVPAAFEPTVAEPAAPPQFLCGHCLAPIDRIGPRRHQHCQRCRRHLSVPHRVHVRCPRCDRRHSIHPRELGTEHRCAACDHPLTIGRVLLAPARRRHRNRLITHASHRSRHDHAVSLLLMIGLALLAGVMLFSR